MAATRSHNTMLALLLLLAACTFATVESSRTLNGVDLRSSSCPNLIKQGQKGTCVSSLQSLLNSKGASPKLVVDGDFGPKTLAAVKSFQSRKHLQVDGIAGPKTKAALYAKASSTPAPAPAGSTARAKVLAAVRAQKGLPYVWGGGHKAKPGKSTGTCSGYTGRIQPCSAPGGPLHTVGFDCSGLTRWAYYKATGRDILNGATGTQESKLRNEGKRTYRPRPGDVIFWDGHTAIYAGKTMIEAQQTGVPIHEVPLRSGGRYYRVLA